jgi:hypothetical protein
MLRKGLHQRDGLVADIGALRTRAHRLSQVDTYVLRASIAGSKPTRYTAQVGKGSISFGFWAIRHFVAAARNLLSMRLYNELEGFVDLWTNFLAASAPMRNNSMVSTRFAKILDFPTNTKRDVDLHCRAPNLFVDGAAVICDFVSTVLSKSLRLARA